MEKKCKQCGVEKPLTEFHKQSSNKDGRRGICKVCRSGNECADYYSKNRVRIMEYVSQWRSENPERVAEYNRKHVQSGKKAESDRAWARNNPERAAGARANYRARVAGATVDNMHPEWRTFIFQFYGDSCIVPDCERKANTIDHVVPLSQGGDHALWNLQPMCNRHNAGKCNRNQDDYRTGPILFDRVI